MSKPITLRLDAPDYDRLEEEAISLGMRPGTLARVLIHASLTTPGTPSTSRLDEALARLAALTRASRPWTL